MNGLPNLSKQRSTGFYMNKIFVKTTNVKNFIGLVENLVNKPKKIPRMGLVYGEPGLGKSQTALWLACKYDAIYLRATNLMTGRWLLEELVKELDEIPRYLTSDNFNLVVKKLKQEPKIIFIDEIDYLMNNYKSIETLRDIHDETGCPIIFIGMSLAHRKLERYKHLYDRFSEILKFETFGINDLSQIINQLSEIPFTSDSIEYIHKKYNRFRQIVQLINQLETFAKDNNLAEINLEVINQIL
jgi:Cdc6-like AAA superfamily ATPase